MKSTYRVSAFEVFSALKDRGVRNPEIHLCDSLAIWLGEGGGGYAHGFKFQAVKGGKFRVYARKA